MPWSAAATRSTQGSPTIAAVAVARRKRVYRARARWCRRAPALPAPVKTKAITSSLLLTDSARLRRFPAPQPCFSTLVVASCRVRHRYFAGIAKIGDVRLHAGFKATLASLDIRAIALQLTCTTRLGFCRSWLGPTLKKAGATGPGLYSLIRRSGAASRRSGRTLLDALHHRGRDAREHGLGLRGLQYVDDQVRPWRLPLKLATAEDIPKLTGLLM